MNDKLKKFFFVDKKHEPKQRNVCMGDAHSDKWPNLKIHKFKNFLCDSKIYFIRFWKFKAVDCETSIM